MYQSLTGHIIMSDPEWRALQACIDGRATPLPEFACTLVGFGIVCPELAYELDWPIPRSWRKYHTNRVD